MTPLLEPCFGIDGAEVHAGRPDLIGLTLLLQSLDLSSNRADKAAHDVERDHILLARQIMVGVSTGPIHGRGVRVPWLPAHGHSAEARYRSSA